MRIAYCEDETAQAVLVKEKISEWCVRNEKSCEVDLYQSAENFLFELNGSKDVPYDLLILDISMKNMDGFSLARQIRRKDQTVKIAFLTSDPSHVFEGYELAAWRYLLKPLDDGKIREMMNAFCDSVENEKMRYCIFEVSGEHIRIALDTIEYIEAEGHYITLHYNGQKLTMKQNFNQILNQLNEGSGSEHLMFEKCHRSYAVNVRKVQKIGREALILGGNIELPVSRGMYQQINQAFIEENL